MEPIAPKIGCVPQTLLGRVQRIEADAGLRSSVTTAESIHRRAPLEDPKGDGTGPTLEWVFWFNPTN